MGSLMPGWDHTLPDPKKVMKRSKTSLTKEEIEAYWRHKEQEIEAHSKESNDQDSNTVTQTVISETTLTTTEVTESDGTVVTQETVITWPQPTASSRDWWTRSNWAYLNAPPELTDYPGQPRRPYVPQHDVATRYNRSVSSAV